MILSDKILSLLSLTAFIETKKPRLTEKTIKAWLNLFRFGNADDPDFRRRLVDTFIARVEVKNGEARIFYNISGEGSDTFAKVDQTGVEPVSEALSTVLLQAYLIGFHSLMYAVVSTRMHSVAS